MFSRILVANRGEIALRIIRTCKRLGIETVVAYSQADKDAVYLRLADRAICIGPPPAKNSYLNTNNLIAAAEISDVEAIHPGYGFLSESAEFAEVCRSCKIAFIGPPSQAMGVLGDKIKARQLARGAGVPVVPGSGDGVATEEEALKMAEELGYPVLLKAAAGGGGRGMRVSHNPISLRGNFLQARAEAESAFGDGTLYLEKYLESIRHVEVQVLADEHGTMVYLGDRDCTVQRRNQKLIEETPSPALDKRTRYDMEIAALRLLKAAKYANAGTVEFIYDLKTGKHYFMEVNTRLQVEHPVTEMVTGLDLVEEQIRVASGEKLRWRQKDIQERIAAGGHALECRLNAEDPQRGFAPAPGRIAMYCAPVGRDVRIDTHVYTGYNIPAFYDSLLGKLVVHGRDRSESIRRMTHALDELILEGVPTTQGLLKEILGHAKFVAGQYDTSFLSSEMGL